MQRNNHAIQRFFAELGPGLITGAADDDPSGIATYSVTRRAVRLRPAVDRSVLFAPHGGGADDVLAPGHGRRARFGARGAQQYSRWVLWGACLLLLWPT